MPALATVVRIGGRLGGIADRARPVRRIESVERCLRAGAGVDSFIDGGIEGRVVEGRRVLGFRVALVSDVPDSDELAAARDGQRCDEKRPSEEARASRADALRMGSKPRGSLRCKGDSSRS